MTSIRPGTKTKFWSPRFTNRPDVEPPWLLKLAGAVSLISAVGVLIYAVAISLDIGFTVVPAGIESAYIAVLHFVLPVCIFYTVTVNSPLSRLAIGVYALTLGWATMTGRGFLGGLPVSASTRIAVTAVGVVVLFWWLFGSPRMRVYYAVITDRPIPEDLRARGDELQGGVNLNPRIRTALEWMVDRVETAVLLGFIALVLYMWWSTG